LVRPMVHSVKHYVQFPIDSIGTGTLDRNAIINSVAVQDKNVAIEVEEGSSVKAVYFELWLQNQSNLGEFILTISKESENLAGPTFAEHSTLFTYLNKKNILYTSQGLTSNDGISGPVNVLRNWVKIPKSKQRFGLGDTLNLCVSNVSSNSLNICGFATFKEYK